MTEAKRTIGDLALLGGPQQFSQPLHVGRPNVGDKAAFLERVEQIFERRWFTNHGPMVAELESRIASFLDVKHCVLTCNATIALQMAIRALKLTGEVIMPAFTFIATAHALSWQEVTPVFCDVDPATHNISPEEIEALITPRTSGIIGVHVWGRACDVAAIDTIAKRNKLAVLYDAAHAFGCSISGRRIGSFGDAEVFSFHATKFFNTFEGGAITTNRDDLAADLRLIRNFGFVGPDEVVALGINGKMPEISAAMGLTLLENIDELVRTNRRNHDAYLRGLRGIEGIRLLEYAPEHANNYQYIVVDVDARKADITRDRLVKVLHAENVLARRYFYPACHRSEPYRSNGTLLRRPLGATESLASSLMTLPNGSAVDTEQISQICEIIALAQEGARRGVV